MICINQLLLIFAIHPLYSVVLEHSLLIKLRYYQTVKNVSYVITSLGAL